MPSPNNHRDEPDWVTRLRNDGFDVRGGIANLPEEPRAAFPPMPRRPVLRMVQSILEWFRLPDYPFPNR